METYKEDNQRMNELFRKAREEKPLMHVDEVRNVLPANQPIITSSRGFHFGISQAIVISGIIISTGLAYMTMKKDKADKADITPNSEQIIKAPVEPIKENNLSTTSTPPTNNNPIASTNKKLIIPPVDNHKKVSLNEEYTPSEKFTLTTTIDKPEEGKKFVVTTVGTKVVDITINGVSIAPEEYEQYSDVIATAKGYAEGRIKEEGDKRFLMNFFDKHLRADKLPSDENHYMFELTDSKLLIDGMAQSDEMFIQYSRFFKEQTGKEVAKGDEYQFKMSRKQLVNKETLVGKIKEEQ